MLGKEIVRIRGGATRSELCPVVGFGISGAEPSGSATTAH